jgi:signal peptidase I
LSLPDDRDERLNQPRGRGWFLEGLQTWGPAILGVLMIRAFLFEPFRIPSSSMVPTLLIGDHVVVSKFAYGVWLHFPFPKRLGWKSIELFDLGDPERGDVIVFRFPKNEADTYIKRVVAIPGDKVRVAGNQVFLGGVPQERVYTDSYEYLDDRCNTRRARHYVETFGEQRHEVLTNIGSGGPLSESTEVVVPPGMVFVMGDNRDNSEDSRAWGFVRYDQIKGKAHTIWLSLDFCAGDVYKPRGDRFFRSLYTEPGRAGGSSMDARAAEP